MDPSEAAARPGLDAASPADDRRIAAYEQALGALTDPKAEELRPRALEAILAREALSGAAADGSELAASSVVRIAELDARLRAKAPELAAAVGPSTLAAWRRVVQPPSRSWWWSLDEVAAPRSNPLWTVLAAAFLTLALSLATEVSLRFLSGGPDFFGVLSSLSLALLALVASSAFTQAGGRWVERALSRRDVGRRSSGAWKAGLGFAVLLAILGLRLSLPGVARLYNDRGVYLQQEGRVASARQSFERAVRLYPDYAAAHYNLADAQEETLEYDEAFSGYRRAIRMDERLYPAYNNLARLYILRRGDPASALELLNAALEVKPQEPKVRYSLYKNRGWAHFGLGLLGQAESDLVKALDLREDGAAAHCLLAQVLEARQDPGTTAEWEACVAYAPGQEREVEASWLGLAKERLR